MRQESRPRRRAEAPPEVLLRLADYPRHLVVFGDPTKLDGARRNVEVASEHFLHILLDDTLKDYDATTLDHFSLGPIRVWLIYIAKQEHSVGQAIAAAEKQFKKEMTFSRNARLSLLQQGVVNDPLYPQQWALQKIEAEPAWDHISKTVTKPVSIAIIDSGIKYDHVDFNALPIVETNILTNPPTTGTGCSPDNTGHGTMLAGTIAALTNNATGIAGVVPAAPSGPVNLTLLAIKFDDARTPPLAAFAAKAIGYAAGRRTRTRAPRAQIINASWHVLDDQGLLRAALDHARARGVLVVTAAGNNRSDNTRMPIVPAGYALDNMIAAMASDRHDNKAEFSNYGANVDLAAPGVDVLTTGLYFLNPAYPEYGGTSAAAAHVSAAAAMLLATDSSWQPNEIRDHLIASADPVPNLDGICRAGGRLNLRRAVCGPFTILQPSGGQRLQRGSMYDVEWRSEYNLAFANTTLEISINGVAAPLASGLANNGRHQVTWPNQPVRNAVLKLRCLQRNLYAESAPFDIV